MAPSDGQGPSTYDSKLRQVSERAIESVGLPHYHSASVWKQFIDNETCRNNLAYVNLLGYMCIETPINDHDELT